eukprot:TRINITY_DN25212_c0_g1_i1.p1 TRINITY_DN25212_c0_g1~~TRINITY_DN25212_c0_g1_i1.p1  ORF type:complete len:333 (+),score=139.87 TRINITY_DN25212_c0_g1_i1:36-1001(+)
MPERKIVKLVRDDSGNPVIKAAAEPCDEKELPPVANLGQFELLEIIGRTELAVVYRAMEKTTGKVVAIKRLDKGALDYMTNEKAIAVRTSWSQETRIHQKLRHPFIVRLHGTFEDLNYKYLVLQYCEHGDLFNYFGDALGHMKEEDVAFYIKQAALALAYLHKHDPVVIHRDLKLENCLIDSNRNLLLADFGSVGVLKTTAERRGTLCGTLDYLSPEFLNKEGMGYKSDVWALGIMAYEMLVGHAPFSGYQDQQSTCDAIAHAEVEIPGHFSDECKNFLNLTINRNEKDRLTMEQVCYHPYLTKHHANFYNPPPRPMCDAP